MMASFDLSAAINFSHLTRGISSCKSFSDLVTSVCMSSSSAPAEHPDSAWSVPVLCDDAWSYWKLVETRSSTLFWMWPENFSHSAGSLILDDIFVWLMACSIWFSLSNLFSYAKISWPGSAVDDPVTLDFVFCLLTKLCCDSKIKWQDEGVEAKLFYLGCEAKSKGA